MMKRRREEKNTEKRGTKKETDGGRERQLGGEGDGGGRGER